MFVEKTRNDMKQQEISPEDVAYILQKRMSMTKEEIQEWIRFLKLEPIPPSLLLITAPPITTITNINDREENRISTKYRDETKNNIFNYANSFRYRSYSTGKILVSIEAAIGIDHIDIPKWDEDIRKAECVIAETLKIAKGCNVQHLVFDVLSNFSKGMVVHVV